MQIDSFRRIHGSIPNPKAAVPDYVELVYGIVLVWGFGDIVSTYAALGASGNIGLEANPWIRMLLEIEPLLVAVLKGAIVLYAGIVLLECRSLVKRVPGWRVWLLLVVGLGWLIVVNNLAVAFAFA